LISNIFFQDLLKENKELQEAILKKDSELEVLEQEVVRMKEEEEAKVVKLKEEQEIRLHQTLDRLRQGALHQDMHTLSVYIFLVSGPCASFSEKPVLAHEVFCRFGNIL
jgi:hypothetical protein